MAAPVYSITRAEIEEFWRRKEVEEEDQRLAAEKEAARIKAKAFKMEDYVFFEQMIREILEEGNKGDISRTNTEARIGIKHWWRRSTYAYLNEPALTSMDEKGRSKLALTYFPQERCTRFCSETPCQPNAATFVIF
ncbi:hypothetical protein PR202_ga19396 [Eleusine coracana subsp. coracana]|uniref:Uncharacterized protein n=1 Tax=Eleusine coracana subsp. coracana TaxID=191504 RepID=A0AAV5CW26_ELECO|nr:hypothetical protein QOZ80_4AG0307520 [Eleusine coracana subsp. coracana]GJN02078.1 hypothetical protein PR202_ga19396 [Eleusine coracana subsp. coracana]